MAAEEKPEHQQLLDDALTREGEAHRLLLEGDWERARKPLRETSELYRRSWEAAPPGAYGRLVGMLKTAILAGDPEAERAAAYARRALPDPPDSPVSWYALALAALVEGDDDLARRAAEGMRPAGNAFARTADAITALADRDQTCYEQALRAIVADFESRNRHLTGIPIADTALVLGRLAEVRPGGEGPTPAGR